MWNTLSQAEPDYKIAYVGSSRLPEDTAAALEAAFASLGEDLNGDGKIAAVLTQYVSDSGTPDDRQTHQRRNIGAVLCQQQIHAGFRHLLGGLYNGRAVQLLASKPPDAVKAGRTRRTASSD